MRGRFVPISLIGSIGRANITEPVYTRFHWLHVQTQCDLKSASKRKINYIILVVSSERLSDQGLNSNVPGHNRAFARRCLAVRYRTIACCWCFTCIRNLFDTSPPDGIVRTSYCARAKLFANASLARQCARARSISVTHPNELFFF